MPGNDSPPKVSVVLAVRNVEKTVGKCLQSLLDQSLKPYEVLVIDDESVDGTPEIVSRFPVDCHRIKHIEGMHAPYARAFGLKMVSGDYVLFGEADAYYDENFLERCTGTILKREDIGGTFGCMRYWREEGDGLFSTLVELNYLDYEKNPDSVMKRARVGEICPWVFRRRVVEDFGVWPSQLTYGEDTYMARKMLSSGHTIEYTPDAYWYHKLPDTLRKACRHRFNFGRHHLQTINLQRRQYLKKSLRRFLYFVVLPFLFAGGLLLASFDSYSILASIFILVIWLVPQLSRILSLARIGRGRKDLWRLILYPTYSFSINFSYFMGLIYGFALDKGGNQEANQGADQA